MANDKRGVDKAVEWLLVQQETLRAMKGSGWQERCEVCGDPVIVYDSSMKPSYYCTSCTAYFPDAPIIAYQKETRKRYFREKAIG